MKGSWENRRKYLFVTTGFFMVVVAYCLLRNLDTKLAETAVTFALIGINANIAGYVFGAVFEDVKTNGKHQ